MQGPLCCSLQSRALSRQEAVHIDQVFMRHMISADLYATVSCSSESSSVAHHQQRADHRARQL